MPHNLTEEYLTDDLEREILEHNCMTMRRQPKRRRISPLAWLQVQAFRLWSGFGWTDYFTKAAR